MALVLKRIFRSERCGNGKDAGTSVFDEQMRTDTMRYPVDRYLVESSKKFDMVNIIDDDIWNTEPALRPEDELILRKLHEMLQSTADDLKLLSGELSKFHKPGVQIKTSPIPLDEEFNEKLHIEEVVNAKFHGYKIVEKQSHSIPEYRPRTNVKLDAPDTKQHEPKISDCSGQLNTQPLRKPNFNRKLGITRTKIIQINGNENCCKTESLEKVHTGNAVSNLSVAYNEFTHKYEEAKVKMPRNALQVQEMPSINIRSELKEQKVLLLDIIPDAKENEKPDTISKNVAVVSIQHNTKPEPETMQSYVPVQYIERHKPSVRKVSKLISTCDSSGSTVAHSDTQVPSKPPKRSVTSIRSSPKSSAHSDCKKRSSKKQLTKPSNSNLDEWRKKLNVVYGTLKVNKKPAKPKTKLKDSPKTPNIPRDNTRKPSVLNNAEYIPYSKLTIGGVRASDIEKEISNIPDKRHIQLSPILNTVLSSRENSFSKTSPRKGKPRDGSKILTTSDENLLQEVIDIERTVSETLSKERKEIYKPVVDPVSSDGDQNQDNDSYADDFEVDKSISSKSGVDKTNSLQYDDSKEHDSPLDHQKSDNDNTEIQAQSTTKSIVHNRTHIKPSNLSFKNSVDIYEFVHLVDTQESGTQSNTTLKISPKQTQTSPRNDIIIQPIHNDLWPAVDPIVEVEKMFKMEKEFIKNLIIEEYGDLLDKNINKPSTSMDVEYKRNVAASQKTTQTSPARVKHIMTSPTTSKTRTTSPFAVLTVDHHTSPLIFFNDEEVKVDIEREDLGISINLSSPRFSLRMPQNSREVLSNLGDTSHKNNSKNIQNTKRDTVSSSSSLDADSSEISSLGEVKLKLRSRLRKNILSSCSESTSSTSTITGSNIQSGILPLKSEGELSYGNKKNNKYSKSEGETSFGLL